MVEPTRRSEAEASEAIGLGGTALFTGRKLPLGRDAEEGVLGRDVEEGVLGRDVERGLPDCC